MRRVFALALVSVAIALVPAPSGAITGGHADGDGHPSVGVIVGQPAGDPRFFACSGALIAPSVFLTAGHCTDFLATSGLPTVVSFDPTYERGVSSSIPVVAFHTHPDFNATAVTNDLGVAILARSVTDLDPIALPPAGLLDTLQAQHNLPPRLTVAGYGSVEHCEGPGPCTLEFGLVRRVAAEHFSSLNRTWFNVQLNRKATSLGGYCIQDSGGPHFLPGTDLSVGVTSWASTCHSNGGVQRIDTPQARNFLSRFVELP